MADNNLLYLTELQGLPVYDKRNRLIGRVKDAGLVPLIDPARIDRLLVGGELAWLSVRYDQVRSISPEGAYLEDENLVPYHSDEYMLRMVRDLLDQQIIDGMGRKVVRVTDVTFDIVNGPRFQALRIRQVDIGLRSMFRRLFRGILPWQVIRRLHVHIPPHSIKWEFANIIERDPQRRLRLNVTNHVLATMHPADLADIFEDLGPADREGILRALDSELAAEALSEMDARVRAAMLERLEARKAADILEEMSPDQAADVLADLEEEMSEEILQQMESAPKTEVEELLEYDEDTAGGMMNTEFVALPESATVREALAAMRQEEDLVENLNTIYLVDAGNRPVKAVPVGRLLLAGHDMPLEELAYETLVVASTEDKVKRVTETFDKYNLLTLPVVDDNGELAGVVTADDIISVLRKH
jgi:magnesium transporter